MRGSHVDDHRLVLVGILGKVAEFRRFCLGQTQNGTHLAHDLASGEFGTWAEFLRALVSDHGHDGAPLN